MSCLIEDGINRNLCSTSDPSTFELERSRNYRLDHEKLDEAFKSPLTFQAEFHRRISCFINSITDPYPSYSLEFRNSHLRYWFSQLQLIPVDSENGIVFIGSSSGRASFVIKAAKKREKEFEFESFVCFQFINHLRSLLPNFVYTYGYFKCSLPQIWNSEIVSWCRGRGKNCSSYLIMENVRDSISFRDYTRNSSERDMIQMLSQVWNSLALMWKRYGLVHGDLHTSNILIRSLNYDISIPVYDQDMKARTYLTTNKLAVIIDYGYVFKDASFGSFNNSTKISNSLIDVLRILLSLSGSSKRHDLVYVCLNYIGIDDERIRMWRKAVDESISVSSYSSYLKKGINIYDFIQFFETKYKPKYGRSTGIDCSIQKKDIDMDSFFIKKENISDVHTFFCIVILHQRRNEPINKLLKLFSFDVVHMERMNWKKRLDEMSRYFKNTVGVSRFALSFKDVDTDKEEEKIKEDMKIIPLFSNHVAEFNLWLFHVESLCYLFDWDIHSLNLGDLKNTSFFVAGILETKIDIIFQNRNTLVLRKRDDSLSRVYNDNIDIVKNL